jgi:hypothetical protein
MGNLLSPLLDSMNSATCRWSLSQAGYDHDSRQKQPTFLYVLVKLIFDNDFELSDDLEILKIKECVHGS